MISTHHITGTIEEPEMLETEIVVGADTVREFAIQERQPAKGSDFAKVYNANKAKNGYGHPPAIWIDWIELEGPIKQNETLLDQTLKDYPVIDSTSSHTVLTELDAVREFLRAFARVAMRQTEASEAFIDQLLAIYHEERTGGELLRVNWNLLEDAMATTLSIVLASPGFLYLNEPGDEEAPRSLNDRELAVRLAYFLWSSPPDATLFELAERNQLSDPKILRQQVDRMIADSRSDEFVSGFVHQWLDMERLDFFQFDVTLHREFDESTRASARQEVYQSFSFASEWGEGPTRQTPQQRLRHDQRSARHFLWHRRRERRHIPQSETPRRFAARRIVGHDRHPRHGQRRRQQQSGRARRLGASPFAERPATSRAAERAADFAIRGSRFLRPASVSPLTWRKPSALAATARSIRSASGWRTSTRPESGVPRSPMAKANG